MLPAHPWGESQEFFDYAVEHHCDTSAQIFPRVFVRVPDKFPSTTGFYSAFRDALDAALSPPSGKGRGQAYTQVVKVST